jgi:hypothetical protein
MGSAAAAQAKNKKERGRKKTVSQESFILLLHVVYNPVSLLLFFLLANGLSYLVYLLYSSSLRLQSSPPLSLFHLPLCPFHLFFPVEFGGETHKSCWVNDLLDGSTMLHLVHYVCAVWSIII